MTLNHTFRVGDRVAFSVKYLRWTQQYTGWRPFARGRVERVELDGMLITVKWDRIPQIDGAVVVVRKTQAHANNLIPESRIPLEAA